MKLRPFPLRLASLALLLPSAALAQGPVRAHPVEVEVVAELDITPGANLLGTTEPRRRSTVAASIDGYVIDYPAEEGRRVPKGEVLARLRDDVLRLQLKEARAALEEIRERHRYAQRDLERARELIKTDAVTQKTLDDRATEERTLALRIPQFEAKVLVLEADIAKKSVQAPFAGQIVAEHTEVGEWLPKGGSVVTLVDIASVFVRVNVPERHVRFLEEGSSLKVRVPAAREETFSGRVVAVSDEGDPESRTFPLRIEVQNDGSLRAGLSAEVEVPAGEARKALVISKDAVLLEGTRSLVFLVTPEGTAERRAVRLGAASGDRFEVLEGLRAGEQVVVRGNERIQPGALVRIVPPATGTQR